MKPLTRRDRNTAPKAANTKQPKVAQASRASKPKGEAQCCAKVSRTVAGCHD